MNSPTPQQVRELRHKYHLTQSAAAAVIYSNLRTWQEWESGRNHMHPAMWELFKLKVKS